MNEFLEQFLLESRELADQATSELLALELAPDNTDSLDSAFRAFHTLKGGAGIVNFTAMSRAVHAAEDALSAVRSGDLQISVELIGECLSCIHQVLQWLDEIRATGDLPIAADRAADAIVRRLGYETDPARRDEAVRFAESARENAGIPDPARRILAEQMLVIAEPDSDGRQGRLASAGRVAANVLRYVAMEADAIRIEQLTSAVLEGGSADLLAEAIASAIGTPQTGARSAATAPLQADNAARTLRVDAKRVNVLVSLTGELIVAKNAIANVAKLAEECGNALASTLGNEYARLERLTASLQHAVLSLRVLPLRTVFRRFSPVVRDMAISLDKPARLVIEGEDTEADKAIVEMLFEPLLHVVRNAMDHGIEAPPDRVAAGKPVIATIRFNAWRQGENVIVEVGDDGRGIDVSRVRRAAAERAIVGDDVLSAMTDQDVIDLIFAPGFSTASEVTGLSGRGVGMDAVRKAVERIGGRVLVESRPGHGSTVRFVLPFSMMMTRVMTVEAAGQMFGIPLDAVVETVRIPRDHIQAIGTAAAFVVRNRTIPLINLAGTLDRPPTHPVAQEAIAVIASISGQLGAFEVDRLGERMDVMLKPFDGLLSGIRGIAGTTLLGDGRVLLILDLHELLV